MPAGPMLRGNWHGKTLGSGSDVWKYWAEKRAGNIDDKAWSRDRGRHRPLVRYLHDDGHRLDDGVGGRGAGHDPADGGLDPGGRSRPSAHGGGLRPAHRRDGVGGSQARATS
jgi:hypothetical protein